MTPTEKYYRIIIGLIRENFFLFLISIVSALLIDYKDLFGKNSLEVYYIGFTFVVLFGTLVTIQKYRNPLQYSPRLVFFVKDRNDSMIKMQPFLDPWVIKLGLVNPKELVNVRYTMYPDLDLGLDLDPNTGVITGYPMEVGNHASEIKMRFLGGSYSTKVRVEVVDTLKEKMIHQRDEFAPPRTVAQLLLREEDLLKREQDLDYDMSQRQEVLEEEYKSKELSLQELIDIEKENFAKQLAEIKKVYEAKLNQKDSTISNINEEMDNKLKQLEDDRNQKIDKLEADMVEALQDKEREFVEFEKESKQRLEEKEKEMESKYNEEKTVDDSRNNEDTGEETTIDKESNEVKVKSSDEENVEKLEKSVDKELVDEEPSEEPEEEVVEEELEEEPEEEVVEEEPEEEEPEEEVVEEEPEEEDEEYDYVSMTKAELVELAKKRGLAFSGTKKKIISRLEDND
tara:strand:- start:107 stop:1474 length:1368 start_codon:yes stop_codon:yes gene_type:complete